MRVFKYIFTFAIISIIIFNSFSIGTVVYSNEKITVEVKGEVKKDEVFELDKGATFEDLLKLIELNDNADISNTAIALAIVSTLLFFNCSKLVISSPISSSYCFNRFCKK